MEFLVSGVGAIFSPNGDCSGNATLTCTCNDGTFVEVPVCVTDICSPVCNFDWKSPCNPKAFPLKITGIK